MPAHTPQKYPVVVGAAQQLRHISSTLSAVEPDLNLVGHGFLLVLAHQGECGTSQANRRSKISDKTKMKPDHPFTRLCRLRRPDASKIQ